MTLVQLRSTGNAQLISRQTALNQGSQVLRHISQNRQNAVDRLFAGFKLNGHADRQGRLDVAFVVSKRDRDAAVCQVKLLLRQGPVLSSDSVQFSLHPLGVGDGVRGKGLQFMTCQPLIHRILSQKRQQEHASRSQMTWHSSTQRKTRVHAPILTISSNVDQLVAIKNRNKGYFLCPHRQTLQRGLNNSGQARRLQVGLTQAHDFRCQPKELAICSDKSQMKQGEQVPPRCRSAQSASLTDLSGRQSRVVFIKGLQNRQALVQASDPVLLVQFCCFVQKLTQVFSWYKPDKGAIIARIVSLIARYCPIQNHFKAFTFKFKPLNIDQIYCRG